MILRVGGIAFVIMLAIWLYCVLDAITTDESRVRHLPKPVWVLIVLLLFEVGALLWLVAGRPRGPAPETPHPPGPNGRRGPARSPVRRPQLPPDDDPEFLADLRRRQRGDDDTSPGPPDAPG